MAVDREFIGHGVRCDGFVTDTQMKWKDETVSSLPMTDTMHVSNRIFLFLIMTDILCRKQY